MATGAGASGPDGGNYYAGTVKASSRAPGLQGLVNTNDPHQYINPAPDSRLNSIISKRRLPLQQGIIQQTDDMVQGGQKFPFACRFMFNPSVINVGYAVNADVLDPSLQTPAQMAGTAVYPGQTSISFSLLFDRTYEVAYNVKAYNLNKIGVYADICALEAVTGARTPVVRTEVDPNTDHATSKITAGQDANNLMLGSMRPTPVYVIFGGGNGGLNLEPLTGLTYIGWIMSMNVTYGLFSSSMVPTRASVDITMQTLAGLNAKDFQFGGGTLIERIHARETTASTRVRPGGL